MSAIRKAVVAVFFLSASLGSAAATEIQSLLNDAPGAAPLLEVRDAALCRNWNRECSRMWGYGSENWNACMSQPAALWDCGNDNAPANYGSRGSSNCQNWRDECARLHGDHTRAWRACMRQPNARSDCGRY